MLPTPMKSMAPAQGQPMTNRPAPAQAMKQKKPMMPKLNAALAAKQAGQTPQMQFRGAAGGQLPGQIGPQPQSVLGGARLLPQQAQAGQVRANAARGQMEQQRMMQQKMAAREAAMQQQQQAGGEEMPQQEMPPMGMDADQQAMRQQLMDRRAQMEQMQQGQQVPQSLVPQDAMQQGPPPDQRMGALGGMNEMGMRQRQMMEMQRRQQAGQLQGGFGGGGFGGFGGGFGG